MVPGPHEANVLHKSLPRINVEAETRMENTCNQIVYQMQRWFILKVKILRRILACLKCLNYWRFALNGVVLNWGQDVSQHLQLSDIWKSRLYNNYSTINAIDIHQIKAYGNDVYIFKWHCCSHLLACGCTASWELSFLRFCPFLAVTDNSFWAHFGAKIWNSLPSYMRSADFSTDRFKRALKTHLFVWGRSASEINLKARCV